MLTEQEIERRRRDLANVLASQRLEGLEVDTKTLADLERMALGEIEITDAIEAIKARIESGQYRTKAHELDLSRG